MFNELPSKTTPCDNVEDSRSDRVSDLFRKEVIDAQSNQWFGELSINHPISSLFIALGAALIGVGLLLFIAFGTYSRSARVVGVVVPVAGTISVSAPAAGVIAKVITGEGVQVKRGIPIFELSTDRQAGHGEISMLIGQQIAVRKQTLQHELRERKAQALEKQAALKAKIENLNTERSQLNQEIELVKRREALAKETTRKYEALQREGFVSESQTQEKQEMALDQAARLGELKRVVVQLNSNRIAVEADLAESSRILQADVAQLERSLASVEQEDIENESRGRIIIVAPRDGVISTITYKPGQFVNGGQIIATMLPSEHGEDNLEVNLFAPSRTAGFVLPGQIVNIRYQAFPFQKFGLYSGKITDISRTPFAPTELPANLASTILSNSEQNIIGSNNSEGLYRIRVKLMEQHVNVYGLKKDIKPGMTLEADIIQDSRKIWEWILEPIYAVTRH
jgi:membrane fusion protein